MKKSDSKPLSLATLSILGQPPSSRSEGFFNIRGILAFTIFVRWTQPTLHDGASWDY